MNKTSEKSQLPIGVFDSGVGGLTIVRELRKAMPNESICYFGDLARLPYGTKSQKQIQRFSEENTRFLESKGIKALVIACNSSSSSSFLLLKRKFKFPILDVIHPAVRQALSATRSKRIGVIGTYATIASGAYEKTIKKQNEKMRVFSQACPLFVSFVEESMVDTKLGTGVVEHYLKGVKAQKVDVLILGCTHYPLLKKKIQKFMGAGVTLIDSAGPCSVDLQKELEARGLRNQNSKKGTLKTYLSDESPHFVKIGEKFLKEKLNHMEIVRS